MQHIFKNFVMFKATIPYEFKLSNSDYIFNTNVKLDFNLNNCNRRFIVHIDRVYLENQKVPSTNSYFAKMIFPDLLFSYNISKVEIQLELFDNEIEKISKYYSNGNEGINSLSSILQNILLVFAYIYNQTQNGKEYYIPNVEFYGPFVSSLFLEKNPNNDSGAIITVSYSLSKLSNNGTLELDEIQPLQWINYFNRAKYSYNQYDNLDAILFATISLESYLIWLINSNGLKDLFDEYKNNNDSISFYMETRFLRNHGCITKEKEKRMRKTFSILKDYRNSIVHGDLESPFIEREAAFFCINTLIDFYSKYK